MKEVIVVESGAKTKTIRQFLRGQYDVIACGGHIVDLPDGELGIDVENDFAFRVEPLSSGGKSKVQRVRERLADADRVYLATDPDREGEAIAADLKEFCVAAGTEVQRIAFNAIVYHAVKEALENPRDIDQCLVESQRARRSLDRLIGFILSAWAKFDPEGPQCPSVGRVLAPSVSLVVDREREIANFESRKYWTLHAQIELGEQSFQADFEGEWDAFEEAEAVRKIINEHESMEVVECDEDPENLRHPPPPFSTDTLLDEADRLFNFTPEKTMRIAQKLYQGVDIDTKVQALITYMRTDSTRVSPEGLNLAKKALASHEDLGESMYQGRPWKPRGAAMDAHEGIRPTVPHEPPFFPESLKGKLDEDSLNLYRLIYIRFLSSQMIPAHYHTTRLTLKADEYVAHAEGHRLVREGFLKLYRQIYPEHGLKETDLPRLENGLLLPVQNTWPEDHKTFPPPRYREGGLIRELKERGIGRPSTYATVLNKIKQGNEGFGYLRKVGGRLRPTRKGEALCTYLRQKYRPVIDYQYTAKMEQELQRIEECKYGYQELLASEFEWLKEPYEIAVVEGWMDGERPGPAQIEYLRALIAEMGVQVPEEDFKNKKKVGAWIDKLLKERPIILRLFSIHKAEVSGVECFRFRLESNKSLPDEEHTFLKSKKMKVRKTSGNAAPFYQFQRQSQEAVEKLWNELKERYQGKDSPVDKLELIDEN